jgi:hypothetical protein
VVAQEEEVAVVEEGKQGGPMAAAVEQERWLPAERLQ